MYGNLIKGYSPVGDVFLIALSVLFILVEKGTYMQDSKRARIFRHALVALPLAAMVNVATFYLARAGVGALIVVTFRNLYHACLLLLFFFFEIYVAAMIGYEDVVVNRIRLVSSLLNGTAAVAGFLSPLTGFGIHQDELGQWITPSWQKPFTIAYFINVIVISIILLTHKTKIIRNVRFILILTVIICLFFVVVENNNGHNSYLALTFALPVAVVLLMFHSNSFNAESGSLDGRTFNDYLSSRFAREKTDTFLCIKFYTDEVFKLPKGLGQIFYSFYDDYVKDGVVFNPINGYYILAVKDEKNPDGINAIQVLTREIFPKYYQEFRLDYKIIVFQKPKISSFDEFYDLFSYFEFRMERNTNKYVNDEEIKKYEESKYILAQIMDIAEKNDLEDERVKVFCQPILNVRTKHFDTAEALMRLELPQVGMVYPDVFIPIAEDNGYIHKLSMIILNKTCVCVRQLMDEGYDFERVSVNFSDMELASDTFIHEFASIVRDNKVPFEKIGVELTESRNDSDYDTVWDIVMGLKELGTPLYLDDFGTGYSNFDRILSLKFDVIKFDRSLLLLSEKQAEYLTMIEHFAEGFSDLGYTVLYEGVETEGHEKMCVQGRADYLQGYKYSKPIPIAKLREYFSVKEKGRA